MSSVKKDYLLNFRPIKKRERQSSILQKIPLLRNNYFSHGGAIKLLDKMYNEINRTISSFRPRGPRICNGRESDKECPITRVGKSGTSRHAEHVSPIIYESITYLPNFWSTRDTNCLSVPHLITSPNYKHYRRHARPCARQQTIIDRNCRR